MTSIQDVDWGPASWMPLTDKPIFLNTVFVLLKSFGYELGPGWPVVSVLTFVKANASPITILPPDFKCRKTGRPAYERDAIVDMLTRVMAGPSGERNDAQVVLKVMAVLEQAAPSQ